MSRKFFWGVPLESMARKVSVGVSSGDVVQLVGPSQKNICSNLDFFSSDIVSIVLSSSYLYPVPIERRWEGFEVSVCEFFQCGVSLACLVCFIFLPFCILAERISRAVALQVCCASVLHV